MNPQPQTIIHHSAVIVNRPNRRNEPQTVSEPSEIGSFGARPHEKCELDCTTNEPRALLYRKLCVCQHNKFGVFPENFPWHWLWGRAWEWWIGQEEYFFDAISFTKYETWSSKCQKPLTVSPGASQSISSLSLFSCDQSLIIFTDPTLSELYMFRCLDTTQWSLASICF